MKTALCFPRFRPFRCILLSTGWLAAWVGPVEAADYYLGSAAATQGGVPLSSIQELNAINLRPGDRVFFQGGETFAGNLQFNAADAGTPQNPVVITSFGEGRATLAAGSGAGITLLNAGGFDISRLVLVGDNPDTQAHSGVRAGVERPDDQKVEHLRLSDMKISGFRIGVEVWGWSSTPTLAWPGWRDVVLSHLEVVDNRADGIVVWGTWQSGQPAGRYSHQDITVRHCVVARNRGDPGATQHTGSGIILGGVDGGVVEYCVAHDNGGRGPRTGGGPFGIWTWDSQRITLQHNLVFNQKTSSNLDGGAYDLDGGTRRSVVQYNYSRDNHGPAVGIIQFAGAAPVQHNVVRYNLSENDARQSTRQGVFHVANFAGHARIDSIDLYGNTVFVSADSRGRPPPAVMIEPTGEVSGLQVFNNLFIADHGGDLLSGRQSTDAVLYRGNNYWGGRFDLAAFRAGGQETRDGQPLGLRVEPQLQSPGQGGALRTATDPQLGSAYRLHPASPLLRGGVDLQAAGLEVGSRDFFGHPLPSPLTTIGADAVASASSTSPAPDGGGPEPSGSATLRNLSARARAGTGADRLIVGWVTEGQTRLLVRGIGPGLAAFDVPGFLPDPQLRLFDPAAAEVASNDDWGNGSDRAAVEQANAEVSAFALAAKDAGLARGFAPGAWSAHVQGGQRGVALAEIYRTSGGAGRLINLSARGHAGGGGDTLIAGFVIAGGPARVLVRGLGPALAPHGVTNFLPDPRLQLYAGDSELRSNDNWEQADRSAIAATGLAPPPGSKDAAILMNLAPGAYTVHLGGADAREGVGLLEIYLLR